ncbi:hypothetical protein [Mycoplasma sp. 4F]|uniref:hypothetical protein n=1 Tax=Mycoplasma sp. 4F TaxID=3401664 RepID=UPI003AAB26C4
METIDTFNIDELHLALWNPRFETVDEFKFDFIKHFTNEDNCYKLDKEIELISELFVESPKEFKKLFESIYKKFYAKNEKIQLIKNKNNYIVIEGNRRISCLKILANFDVYYNYLSEYENLTFPSERQINLKKIISFY